MERSIWRKFFFLVFVIGGGVFVFFSSRLSVEGLLTKKKSWIPMATHRSFGFFTWTIIYMMIMMCVCVF